MHPRSQSNRAASGMDSRREGATTTVTVAQRAAAAAINAWWPACGG
ncbi:hypothetical protein ACFOW4_19810 [Micromonospora sp. GCM10011542]